MVVGTKVCGPTDGFLWFVCGLYMGIMTSPLRSTEKAILKALTARAPNYKVSAEPVIRG